MMCEHADLIHRFPELRVVVVGDVMLDRYLAGQVRRISPEAPVPIVEVERIYERAGGAANVAANLRQLGAQTTLVGVVGADEDGARLRAVLADHGLGGGALVEVPGRPTTVKTRVVAHNQQIVRIDREQVAPADGLIAEAILAAFDESGPCDIVILSDYAKGVLSRHVCADLISRCRFTGVPVVVDPKGRDYQRYTGATAITPNQSEAAQAIGAAGGDDLDLARCRRFFLDELRLDAALITQGERGMTLLLPHHPPRAFPATAREVADVTGAGDTAAGVFALCLAAGAGFPAATFVANVAAGVVVGMAGTATITPEELAEALQQIPSGRVRRAR
jgi:D-beta-D-heptose 7-phosphate kinase/D-beta-D-heptose 1-phosphate adenosyltransferase